MKFEIPSKGRPRKPEMMYFGVRIHKDVAQTIRAEARLRKLPIGTFVEVCLAAYLCSQEAQDHMEQLANEEEQ